MGQRSDAWHAIPLARPLHQLGYKTPEWPWQDDVPIHAGRMPFERRYGMWEPGLLAATYVRLIHEYGDQGLQIPEEIADEVCGTITST